MSTTIKCSFCNQSFDFDNSSGSLLVTCPHCGKQNSVAVHSNTTQRFHILRNAPSLIGGKPCPKCKEQIAVDDMICVHCGFNLVTRKRIKGSPGASGRRTWIRLCGVVLLFLVAFAIYKRFPQVELTIPSFVDEWSTSAPPEPTAEPVVAPSAGPERPQDVQPAPPPPEDARVLFEAQKAKAEQAYRQKLDEDVPLYNPTDSVVLRRKDGRMVHGTFEFVGKGSNRIVIVATEEGKESIPLRDLDRNSRIQLDPQARENHIRDRLNIQIPAPSANPATTK